MQIGSQTNYVCKLFGDVGGLQVLKDAGFDCVDLNLFDWTPHANDTDEDLDAFISTLTERYTKLRVEADRIGIRVSQVHAPFPTTKEDADYNRKMRKLTEKSIEISSIMGSKYVVIHPLFIKPFRIYDEGVEKTKQDNIEFFSSLFPVFKKYNVQLGVDNMWARDPRSKKIVETVCSRAEEMCDFIDTFNRLAGFEVAVACLDIGHSNLTGDTPWNMIKILGNRLRLLHTHATLPNTDLHSAPYLGEINWDKTMAALRDCGYKGDLSFEADHFFVTFGPDLIKDSTHMLYRIGKVLTEKYGL